MYKFISFIFLSCSLLLAGSINIRHDQRFLTISEQNGQASVDYSGVNNLSPLSPETGAPDLPVYVYTLVLDRDESIDHISVSVIKEKEIDGRYTVKPRQNAWRQDSPPSTIEANAAIYQSDEIYPADVARFAGVKYFQGVPIAHFIIHPLRYRPASGRLYLVEQLSIEYNSHRDQKAVVPFELKELNRHTLRRASFNVFSKTEALQNYPIESGPSTAGHPDASLSSGLIDRYVIITADEFVDALQPLADWKIRRGVPTVIRTLDWIRQNFPNGVDDAERLRNFIRWTYQKRGTQYVLLAGETDIIPSRMLHTGGFDFPADYYFSDLDGTWNADQDNIFGEAVDNLDAYPEMYVGRIPVSSPEEITFFLEKLFRYEKMSGVDDPGYIGQVLYTAGNLSKENDGRDLILKHIDPIINPTFERTVITQSNQIGGNAQPMLDELNKSHGIIFSEHHGLYHTIRAGSGGSNIYGFQLERLDNAFPGLWYMASCYTNDIVKRAFSESYLLNKSGGGIAYIGNSSYEYPFSGIYLQKEFFSQVFRKGNFHLAEAHYLSRLPYLGYLSFEGPSRIIVFSTVVLGDPEMPVWTEVPRKMNVAVAHENGDAGNWLRVTVREDSSALPLQAATVVLYKKDVHYAVYYTDSDGQARIPVTLLHSDSVSLTVSKHNFIPTEGFLDFSSSRLSIDIDHSKLNDLSGNGNGYCEPGEKIEVSLNIKNHDQQAAEGHFQAKISCPDPLVTLLADSSSVTALLQPADSLWLGGLSFRIDAAYPADTTLALQTTLYLDDEIVADRTIALNINRPELTLYRTTITTSPVADDGPDSLVSRIAVELYNAGQGMASSLSGILRPDSGQVVIEVDSIHFGNITGGERSSGSAEFEIKHNQPADELSFVLDIRDRYKRSWSWPITFQSPQPPASLSFMPYNAHSIQLSWPTAESGRVAGYHIFRRPADSTGFSQITREAVKNAGYFVDENVVPDSFYEYIIRSVDPSGNFSASPSDTILAWPNLPFQKNFPVQMSSKGIGSEISGAVVADVDGDQQNEIIAAGAHGTLQIFSQEGKLLFNIEGLEGDMTVPAVGNVYGGRDPEVVVSSFAEGKDINNIYIIDPRAGTLIQTLPLGYSVPTSVVLKDIFHSGYQDIIVLTHRGNSPQQPKLSRLYIFESSGSEWQPPAGWPETGFEFSDGYSLGVPAAADLDHSGEVSVVVGTQAGKLYLFQPDLSANPLWVKTISGYLNTPISLADVDNDGRTDIVLAAVREDKLHALNSLGEPLPGWEDGKDVQVTDPYIHASPAIIGNLDEDPYLEIIYVGRKKLYIFEHDGSLKEGWPITIENGDGYFDPSREVLSPYSSPVLADINQDNVPEIIYINTFGILHARDSQTSKDIQGFPINTWNDMVNGQSPLVDDVDRDGDLEVVYVSHEGKLHVWDAPHRYGSSTRLFWNQPLANIQHTGELDTTQISIVSSIRNNSETEHLPQTFYMNQNYPNPFNPQTRIEFGTKEKARVRLKVYNTLGQEIITLLDEVKPAGAHQVNWLAGKGHASGIYFYRIEMSDTKSGKVLFSKINKMILLK